MSDLSIDLSVLAVVLYFIMKMMVDITIIGAGITGSLIAHALSKFNLGVLVLEKENDVAEGATGANSAMVHSGHDPKPGTLKCRYNLLGNRMYPDLCRELQVSYLPIGAFVAAGGEEEEKTLKLGYEVKNIAREDDHFVINDEIETRCIVNCAGAHCDEITEMLRPSPYKVEARKGEYFVLDHLDGSFVKHVIYPVPGPRGKGVLAVPTVHGNVLLGPNSDECEDRDDDSTGEGLIYVQNEIGKTMTNVPYRKLIHTFAGLRPHIDLKDFYIREDEQISGFIHVAGIESPGLTAAPAIAKDVVETILMPKFPDCRVKENYLRRRPFINMAEMSDEQINELIEKDPSFGKIICRCEKISKGQIIDVIRRKCGARTIKGVKMRCRPGMGRCQGGFCEPEVLKILAEELHEDMEEILLDGDHSNVLMAKAKEDL